MSAETLRRAAALMRMRAEAATPGPWMAKVTTSDDCWVWNAGVSGSGYGRYWHEVEKRFVQAHRYAYESVVGLIPDGLVIDHLCRNRLCVRPDHLSPVTHAENVRRGAKSVLVVECAKGHEYSPENTYVKPNGCRDCRTCRTERKRRYRRECISVA